jgi:tripartite-type tricarboxylate transporter receptor subunit TctC
VPRALPRGAWPALAQACPLRVIVPSTPCGATDITPRVIAEKAAAMLGLPVVIENRPGGGGGSGVTVD